jgi:predicted glycosyltransferase
LIKKLAERYRVFITCEGTLQEEFKQFKLTIPPHLLHHVLAFAEIVISEGATIASESGLLGSPAVYYSTIARSYLEDQEKYGTVYNCQPGNGVMEKIENIISEDKKVYKEKSEKLIADKIDVNAFTVWFVENYPQSFRVMKNDPNVQLQFK